MDRHSQLKQFIEQHPGAIGKVVDFDSASDGLLSFDFTLNNTELSPADVADTTKFDAWVTRKLQEGNYRYGIGGYMENRTLYARSELFNKDEEPRRLHLGVDIWAEAGTPVYAAFDGKVHSFQDNDHFGDYGPTIILEHDLNGLMLYSLYGHLSRPDLDGLTKGMPVKTGQRIASFGDVEVNGHWPPHLHFQLMFDLEGWEGDYPGVGYFSQKDKYLENIPDPDLVLGMNRYV